MKCTVIWRRTGRRRRPTPGIVSDEVYGDLASHWSPAQTVEITAVIAMFNFFNRFAHALAIPVTK